MKDQGPRYDPIVAQVLGFDPNPDYRDSIERTTEFQVGPVVSDIALEFANRMRKRFGDHDGMRFELNRDNLLAVTEFEGVTTRTYFSCIRGRSAKDQVFTPVQTITFRTDKDGNPTLQGIALTTQRPHIPWRELVIEMNEDGAQIQAASQLPVVNLRVYYPKDDSGPNVYINGSKDPIQSTLALSEIGYGSSLYELYPSSVLVPKNFDQEKLINHLDLSDLDTINIHDANYIRDKGKNNEKDPLHKGVGIQWIP